MEPIQIIMNNFDELYLKQALTTYKHDHIFSKDLQNMWWNKYADRRFQNTLYKKISIYLCNHNKNKFCDIGSANYNLLCKEFLDPSIEYTQVEPIYDNFNNDKPLKCFVKEIREKYPEYHKYFDIISEFGVLGFMGISFSWSDDEIQKHIENISFILKDDGIYILQISKGYFDNDRIINFVLKYFRQVSFFEYDRCVQVRIDSKSRPMMRKNDQHRFYFLRKI